MQAVGRPTGRCNPSGHRSGVSAAKTRRTWMSKPSMLEDVYAALPVDKGQTSRCTATGLSWVPKPERQKRQALLEIERQFASVTGGMRLVEMRVTARPNQTWQLA